jgi:hypothetical protein
MDANRRRNEASSIFGAPPPSSPGGIAGISRQDPNSPRVVTPGRRPPSVTTNEHDQAPVAAAGGALSSRATTPGGSEPSRPRIVGGRLVVPGLEQQVEWAVGGGGGGSTSTDPPAAPGISSGGGGGGYGGGHAASFSPGRVEGLQTSAYSSAGTRQEAEHRDRSSVRNLAPPGGHSSLGWAFGGADSGEQDGRGGDGRGRRSLPPTQEQRQFTAASSSTPRRLRIVGGKVIRPAAAAGAGDDDDADSYAPAPPPAAAEHDAYEGAMRRTAAREEARCLGAAPAYTQPGPQDDWRQQQQQQQQHYIPEPELVQPHSALSSPAYLDPPPSWPQPHEHAMAAPLAAAAAEPSARYRFAREPRAAIRRAMLDQLDQGPRQRRLQWRQLCERAGVARDPQFTRDHSLSPEQLCTGLKGFGSGIILEACDVEVAGLCGRISFGAFSAWCGGA